MAREVDRNSERNKFHTKLVFDYEEGAYVCDEEFYSKFKVSPAANKTTEMSHTIFFSRLSCWIHCCIRRNRRYTKDKRRTLA